MNDFNAGAYLKLGESLPDDDFDLGMTCLAVMQPDHDGLSIDRYKNHLNKIADEVRRRHKALLQEGADDDAQTALAALKHVISDTYDYQEDSPYHETLESADLFRVIDRNYGHSAALAVLYINAARKNDWPAEGINFPGRFLCRLNMGGQHLVFDPTAHCKIMQAHDLRNLVKKAKGEDEELSTHYLTGLKTRQMVVALCNLIKLRRIEMGEYEHAVALIERLRVIAPDEYRLLLDAGVLYMRLNENEEAITCLYDYIDAAQSPYEKDEAYLLLRDLEKI